MGLLADSKAAYLAVVGLKSMNVNFRCRLLVSLSTRHYPKYRIYKYFYFCFCPFCLFTAKNVDQTIDNTRKKNSF